MVNGQNSRKWYGTILSFLPVVFLFLLSINLVGEAVTSLGQETARGILLATSNPFIGLFIGLLAAALIQSSSTVTAMTVAVVSTGYLSLGSAIPVVMGANIGTTLTSTLVSLGFITNKNEFRKAISAGSVHDFFNIFTVILLFPLEYYYGVLSNSANYLTSIFGDALNANNVTEGLSFGLGRISEYILTWLPNAVLALVLSLILLFVSIKLISKTISNRIIGTSKFRLRKFIFASPYKSFGWGTLITAAIQSSSITTSLIVPLVASGRVTLKRSFPFILGANIGTTITALIAAFSQSEAAISLAFVHLLFNLIGVLVFLPFPFLRRLPVLVAYKFGALTLDSRIFGFSYIIFTFFLMPFTLIYINKDNAQRNTYTYQISTPESSGHQGVVAFNSEGVNGDKRFLIYHMIEDDGAVSVPDTSFLLAKSTNAFSTPSEVVYYNLQSSMINSMDTITSREENRTYSLGDQKLSNLVMLEVRKSNGTRTDYLFDPNDKVLVRAVVYDSENKMVQTTQLVGIQ